MWALVKTIVVMLLIGTALFLWPIVIALMTVVTIAALIYWEIRRWDERDKDDED
jgi:hypothetical protein